MFLHTYILGVLILFVWRTRNLMMQMMGMFPEAGGQAFLLKS
jgi:hypothetical protein